MAGSESEGQTEGQEGASGRYKDPAQVVSLFVPHESPGGQDGMIRISGGVETGMLKDQAPCPVGVAQSRGTVMGYGLWKGASARTNLGDPLGSKSASGGDAHHTPFPAAQGLLVGSTLAFLDAN